ncbi:hypothetical protein BH24GEM2_BH24GEM2_18460 [soil metagenome]
MNEFMNMKELQRVMKFAVVSGTGLALDFAVFLALTGAAFSSFAANAVSGTCAVTYVYFASVRRIFSPMEAGSFSACSSRTWLTRRLA